MGWQWTTQGTVVSVSSYPLDRYGGSKVNYIKQLQLDKQEALDCLAKAQLEVTELRVYLESSKFWEDTTVQVGDVQNRIMGLRHLLMEGLA